MISLTKTMDKNKYNVFITNTKAKIAAQTNTAFAAHHFHLAHGHFLSILSPVNKV